MNKKIALSGVPNCGKTTLWNRTTGKPGKIGNWPGVTFEKLSAPLKAFPDSELTDIPGIYSLSPKSPEETAAKDFLTSKTIDSLVIVIDGTKPEQGLCLALELIELGVPSVLAINFSDEMKKRGISVNTEKLASSLGIPVFLINAKTGENVSPLIKTAVNFCFKKDIQTFRFSLKERRTRAEKLTGSCFTFKNISAEHKFSNPINFLVQTLLILSSVFLVHVLTDMFSGVFKYFSVLTADRLTDFPISSVFINGLLTGISLVIDFIPDLFTVFLFLSFLEESGIMSQIAFLADGFLKKIGLSGKSVFPLLLGFGCTVSGVCAAKTSGSHSCSKNTVSALMFIPCSARLPLAFLTIETFFKNSVFITLLFLYFFTFFCGLALHMLKNRKQNEFFMLELTPFRVPDFLVLIKSSFRRTKAFVVRSSAVIVLTFVLIRFMNGFTPSLIPISNQDQSILTVFSNAVAPVFLPLGIPSECIVPLICGLFSKESALSSLLSISPDITKNFSVLSALSFLIFYFIYSPCTACLAAISKEFGPKESFLLFFRQLFIAWLASFSFYQFSVLIKNFFIP